MSMLKIFLAVTVLLVLSSCAQVGSERWCSDLKETPKSEWTYKETKDYAAHCFFRKKESE